MSNSEYKKHMKLKDCLGRSKRWQNNITGNRSRRRKKSDDHNEKYFSEECGQNDLQKHHQDVDRTVGKGRC